MIMSNANNNISDSITYVALNQVFISNNMLVFPNANTCKVLEICHNAQRMNNSDDHPSGGSAENAVSLKIKRMRGGVRKSVSFVYKEAPVHGAFSNGDIDVLTIDGESLTCADIDRFVRDSSLRVEIADTAYERIERSHRLVLAHMDKRPVYGVNTGFGPMVTQIISTDKLVDLQYNLVRGHATGVGDPIKAEYVLAAMIVRLNALVKGNSGISRNLVETLATMINKRVTPIIPRHGGVGASGDLTQLAHIALGLIGEGEVMYKGTRRHTAEVFVECGITPHKLQPKEGLSLINGTSVMTGIAALLVCDAHRSHIRAVKAGALSLELVHGFTDVISSELHSVRPHVGQKYVAEVMREHVHDSQLTKERHMANGIVELTKETHAASIQLQEVYSIRCAPQVLGPVYETIIHAEAIVNTEINSVTDNPIVDSDHDAFLHGGNFHGDYVATAVDQLKAALVKLTMLSERRINFFLNKNVNKTFVPFLNLVQPGLTMGLQGLQFVATSTTACSQSLSFPHTIHSIPTNGDNQDIVSMGTDGALMAQEVLTNAHIVQAIEMVTLSQAVEVTGEFQKISSASQDYVIATRAIVPVVKDDRPLTVELNALSASLAQSYEGC